MHALTNTPQRISLYQPHCCVLPSVKGGVEAHPRRLGDDGIGYLPWELVVECDFFLYRMVRKLVGALVAVALGKLSVSDIRFLLKGPNPMTKRRKSAVQENGESLRTWRELSRQVDMAPACGLRMDAVYY